MSVLAVDIGGTSIKVLVMGTSGEPLGPTRSLPTPQPAMPEAVFSVIEELSRDAADFERVSVGFPGVVKRGVAHNAPNLGNELWTKVPLAEPLGERLCRPVRAVNDADLQGLGVVEGQGVELVLTFGTGMGAALFTEGHLVPNLEAGHHPLRDGQSYEDLVRDSELKRIGPSQWTERVLYALQRLEALFNYDLIHLGGGNLRHLQADLPANARSFTLEEALRGAVRLWRARSASAVGDEGV